MSLGKAQVDTDETVIGMRIVVSLDSGQRGPWKLRTPPVTRPARSEQAVEGPHLGRLSNLAERGWERHS